MGTGFPVFIAPRPPDVVFGESACLSGQVPVILAPIEPMAPPDLPQIAASHLLDVVH